MAGSISYRGHKRPKPAPRGSFWRPGEFYTPITVEMTTSPAWRTLGESARSVLIDMIAAYWKASAADTAPPRGGFPYTFSACMIPCSAATFTAASMSITDRGWFRRTRATGPVPHFTPGPWRDYQPANPLPDLPGAPQQGKAKPPKGQNGPLGHFRQSGQVYTPLTPEMLHSEAWRALTPLSRCVLLDMIHRFGEVSRADTLSLPHGFTYALTDCRVDITARSFYAARSAIMACQWFTAPPELQRDGVIRFTSGEWRTYRAPESAKFREVERAKTTYLATRQARRTAFLAKGTGKNQGEGTGKNQGEGDGKKAPTIGKNQGEGSPFAA